MTKPSKSLTTIGRAEEVKLPEITPAGVHARIDTGARTSAIWVSEAFEQNGQLKVVFFGPEHEAYTGEQHLFDSYTQDLVTSSNGHQELRYKIKLKVVLEGRKIVAGFTLANRSTQVYPVLIGRNVLRGKFIVNVKLGKILADGEKELLDRKRQALDQEK